MNWKSIPGYSDYEASDTGEIRRVRGKSCKKLPYVVSQFTTREGYRYIGIRDESGARRTQSVHRLIAFTFLGAPKTKMDVAHNDGDRTNNVLSNLRWDTHVNNLDDMLIHGTRKFGEDSPVSKLTNDKVRDMRKLRMTGVGYKTIAHTFGVGLNTCWLAVNRKTWGHVA